MKRTLHGLGLDALSMGVAAVPFVFALVRAIRTGYDFRYFWVARSHHWSAPWRP